jgi:hypothetical protein
LREDAEGEGDHEPGFVTEAAGSGPGEYVFLRHYVNSLTAIVEKCQISLSAPDDFHDLATLVDPVVEIGRTVGCSAYQNDVVPSPNPDEWPNANWGIGPDSPGFPPAVPPQ